MQLLTIRAAGFSATVDACARDDGQIWFLSLLGNQQSVRALWARLVSRARPPTSAKTSWVAARPAGWPARPGTWRFYSARLPSGAAYHRLLVPQLAAYGCGRHDFLLFARSEDEAPGVTEG